MVHVVVTCCTSLDFLWFWTNPLQQAKVSTAIAASLLHPDKSSVFGAMIYMLCVSKYIKGFTIWWIRFFFRKRFSDESEIFKPSQTNAPISLYFVTITGSRLFSLLLSSLSPPLLLTQPPISQSRLESTFHIQHFGLMAMANDWLQWGMIVLTKWRNAVAACRNLSIMLRNRVGVRTQLKF